MSELEGVVLLHDRILLEAEELPESTSGGIALPKGMKESIVETNVRTGVVRAVGPGNWHAAAMYEENSPGEYQGPDKGLSRSAGIISPMNVEVGDRVVFMRGAMQPIFFGDKTYVLMGNRDIISKISNETKFAYKATVLSREIATA